MLTLWESENKLWTIRIWQIWQQDFTGFKAFPTHLAALSDKPTIYKQKKLDSKYFQNRFSEYSCRSDDVLRWDSDPFRKSFADKNVWWNEIGSLTKFKTNQKFCRWCPNRQVPSHIETSTEICSNQKSHSIKYQDVWVLNMFFSPVFCDPYMINYHWPGPGYSPNDVMTNSITFKFLFLKFSTSLPRQYVFIYSWRSSHSILWCLTFRRHA